MTTAEILAYNGIKGVLLDLDDTLLRTHNLFEIAHAHIRRWLLETYMIPEAESQQAIRSIQKRSYALHHVDPLPGLTHTFADLDDLYNLGEAGVQYCIDTVMSVYTQVPEIIPGSEEFLQQLTAAGVALGLVTHASPEWTQLKLAATGLGRFFDHVEVVPMTQPKGADSWQKALDTLRLFPGQTLAAGDNLAGDVVAAHSIGIAHLVWLNHPESWHAYKAGELPAGALELHSLAELLPSLEQRITNELVLR